MNKTSISYLVAISCSFLSSTVVAQQDSDEINIAVIKQAKVFADFRQSLPAVVNYYTKLSQDEVIAFYKKAYGEPIERSTKRGRLTLKYSVDNKKIRIIVSEQNNQRQVDILVN